MFFEVVSSLTHRTVRRQRSRKCPRSPNRTTATLFAIKWGHDATVLGQLCMVFFWVKLEHFLRYGKQSRNISPALFFWTETQTLESGSHFCFTSNNSLITRYGRQILHYLWCLDTNKDGKGDMRVSSTVHWSSKTSTRKYKYSRDSGLLHYYILMLWQINKHGYNT